MDKVSCITLMVPKMMVVGNTIKNTVPLSTLNPMAIPSSKNGRKENESNEFDRLPEP